MEEQPLTALQVIGVRYRQSTPAPGDERALDAYAAAGVYQQAERPFEIVEPAMPKAQRRNEESDNLGLLGGAIAEAVAAARRKDKAVLMTGGDCNHMKSGGAGGCICFWRG